jgi:hypothetical protein
MPLRGTTETAALAILMQPLLARHHLDACPLQLIQHPAEGGMLPVPDLDPVWRSAGAIRALAMLGDQALQPLRGPLYPTNGHHQLGGAFPKSATLRNFEVAERARTALTIADLRGPNASTRVAPTLPNRVQRGRRSSDVGACR